VIRVRRIQPPATLEFRPAAGAWWDLRESDLTMIQAEIGELAELRTSARRS
jgi:hypothetical protein